MNWKPSKQVFAGIAAALVGSGVIASAGLAVNFAIRDDAGVRGSAGADRGQTLVFDPFEMRQVAVDRNTESPLMEYAVARGRAISYAGVNQVGFGSIRVPPMSKFRKPPIGPNRP